MYFPAVYRLR